MKQFHIHTLLHWCHLSSSDDDADQNRKLPDSPAALWRADVVLLFNDQTEIFRFITEGHLDSFLTLSF